MIKKLLLFAVLSCGFFVNAQVPTPPLNCGTWDLNPVGDDNDAFFGSLTIVRTLCGDPVNDRLFAWKLDNPHFGAMVTLPPLYSNFSATPPITFNSGVIAWTGNTNNVPEGSNLYFTQTRARGSVSNGSGLSYASGVFSLDATTQSALSSISGKFNSPTGNSSQYLNGAGTPTTFPTVYQFTGSSAQYTKGDGSYGTLPGTTTRTFTTPTFSASTTASQLSTTRDSEVQYDYDASVTISVLAGQSVTAVLEYADNSGMSTNVVVVESQTVSNSGVLNLTQTNTLRVGGYIPSGKYRKVRFVTSGTGAASPTALKSGQEVLL